MVSAACWKAAREQARRAAEEVLLQGSNLQLWGIYMNLPYLGVQLLTCTSTGLTFISWDITPYNYGYTTYLFMELHPQVPSVNHGSGTYDIYG